MSPLKKRLLYCLPLILLGFAVSGCGDSNSSAPSTPQAVELTGDEAPGDVAPLSDTAADNTDDTTTHDDVETAAPDVPGDTLQTDANGDAPTTPDVRGDTRQAGEDGDAPTNVIGDKETRWGTITGACGAASAAVQQQAVAVLHTTYTFTDEASFDASQLSGKAKQRFEGPNAGGSSKCSEVMSMQLLIDCEGATVLKTETEVTYLVEGKIADYLTEIGGVKAGVSVTRAYKGPGNDVYTLEDATTLLEKKLSGIEQAQSNVSAEDAWQKSIVHVWTLHADWADIVASAWDALDTDAKGSALVLITVEEGSEYIVSDACDE